MKILIAYDDSDCAKNALEDLKNAGLPPQTEARILMVTENWSLIYEEMEKELPPEERSDYPTPMQIEQIRAQAHVAFAQTEKLVQDVAVRLKEDFPSWQISGKVMPGFAHWSILEEAGKWNPDLIVVGSHGRNLIGRAAFGSSSLKILTESRCSVRVARCAAARTTDDDSPQRIIVAFDGSPNSISAAEAVARRSWRQNSAVRFVTAIEPMMFAAPDFNLDLENVKSARNAVARKLEAAGLHVSTIEQIGDPKKVLIKEAETWGADAIFLGAKGHSFVERVLLGSVSYSVAARANCSVEVVRRLEENQ